MPTIMDALYVSLQMDGAQFTKSAAAARKDVKGIGDASGLAAKDVTAATKVMAEGVSRVRNEVLGLLAAFTAGRSIKAMFADIVGGDANVGRLAKSVGMATAELATLEQAAKRVGGTAEGTGASIGGLVAKITEFQETGQGGEVWVSAFQRMGISLRGANGQMKTMTELFGDMAKWSEGKTPQQSGYWLSQLGLDPGTIRLIQQGRTEFNRTIADTRASGVPDDADAKNAADLESKLASLRQSAEGFARAFLREFIGPINQVLGDISRWITTNGPALRAEIGAFTQTVDGVVQSMGGWVKLSERLFELWAASKVLGLMASVARVGGALTGLGGMAALGPYGLAAGVVLGAGAAAGAMQSPVNDEYGRVVGNWGGKDESKNPAAIPLLREGGNDRRQQDDFIDRLARAIGRFVGHDGPSAGDPSTWGQFASQGAAAQVTSLAPGGPAIPLKPGQQAQNAGAMRKVLTDAGITPEYAAAFIGNGVMESGLNPTSGAGTAHQGIVQWDATRRAAIEAHFGKAVTSMSAQEQAQAIVWELSQSRFKDLNARARSGRDLARASEDVTRFYEAPANYGTPQYGMEVRNRLRASQGVYQAAPNGVPVPGPTFGPQRVSELRWGGSTNNNTDNSSSSTSTTHINSLTVQTAATDGPGVGRALKHYLASDFAVDQRRGLA